MYQLKYACKTQSRKSINTFFHIHFSISNALFEFHSIYLSSQTISLCQQLEKCGVTFLTVHGRTPKQKIKEPSNNDLLREIKQSISIPLIANGDCKTLQDADEMYEKIGCDGVMAARGILTNPTLFSGKYKSTPIECLQEWLDIGMAADDRITFSCFHHHFTFMMEKVLRRRQKVIFNAFTQRQQMLDYLADEFDIRPHPINVPENTICIYDERNYRDRIKKLNIEEKMQSQYNAENSLGKFFMEKLNDDDNSNENSDCDDDNFMQTNMFDIV